MDLFSYENDAYLEEFKALSESAGIDTQHIITAKRRTPEPKYFVGSGKADEIRLQVLAHDAEVVLFNHDLTPGQGRNLEQLFQCRVLDRTELILDIFAQRAQSYEGKLQVELAQLQHLRTCLVRGWTHLERQRGGIGLRGPGETQLETDRRLLDVRIKSIQKKLQRVTKQREQGRRSRRRAEVPTVSLVGYTNAGKSTLFNRMTESSVYAADQLFATLDPTLRQIKLPQVGEVILADTVGFIRELPHDLVAAFRATLEETRQADLLLHVVDCYHPGRRQYAQDVNTVLSEIDASDVPQLLIYNKVDLRDDREAKIDRDENGLPQRVWVSAETGEGIDLLTSAIRERLSHRLVQCEIRLKPDEGQLRHQLYERGVVVDEEVDEQGHWILHVEMQHEDYVKFQGRRR